MEGVPGTCRPGGGRSAGSPGPKGASRDRARSGQIVKGNLTVLPEQTRSHGATAPRAPASQPRPSAQGEQRLRGRDGRVSPTVAAPLVLAVRAAT